MLIALSLVAVAVPIVALYAGQRVRRSRAQAERHAKFDLALRAHEDDSANWGRIVEALKDRMEAWDATDEGQRLAYLAGGLSHIGKPDARGLYHLKFPGRNMPCLCTKEALAKLSGELVDLGAKRRVIWQQVAADRQPGTVTGDPIGLKRC